MAKDNEGLREVPAEEILRKIERGENVEYDRVVVKGDLDVSKLNLPEEDGKSSIVSKISANEKDGREWGNPRRYSIAGSND